MTREVPTLLEMAAAPLAPSPPDRSALVVIDAQLEYVTGRLPLAGVGPALAEIARLLDLARRHKMPVFHILHHGRGLFDPTGPYAEPAPEARPREGETRVIKSLPNAFAGTELDRLLKASGRKELILSGFMTHMCVSATARAALDLGYRTSILAGATATRDLPDPVSGERIEAAHVQRASLAALADRFAIVVPTAASLAAAAK